LLVWCLLAAWLYVTSAHWTDWMRRQVCDMQLQDELMCLTLTAGACPGMPTGKPLPAALPTPGPACTNTAQHSTPQHNNKRCQIYSTGRAHEVRAESGIAYRAQLVRHHYVGAKVRTAVSPWGDTGCHFAPSSRPASRPHSSIPCLQYCTHSFTHCIP
jgi:hypothetical protein